MDTDDLIVELQLQAIEHEDDAEEAMEAGMEDNARELYLKAFELWMRAFSHATALDQAERGRMWIDAVDAIAAADEPHRAWSMIDAALRAEMFTPGIREELRGIRLELPPMA